MQKNERDIVQVFSELPKKVKIFPEIAEIG